MNLSRMSFSSAKARRIRTISLVLGLMFNKAFIRQVFPVSKAVSLCMRKSGTSRLWRRLQSSCSSPSSSSSSSTQPSDTAVKMRFFSRFFLRLCSSLARFALGLLGLDGVSVTSS